MKLKKNFSRAAARLVYYVDKNDVFLNGLRQTLGTAAGVTCVGKKPHAESELFGGMGVKQLFGRRAVFVFSPWNMVDRSRYVCFDVF